MNSQRIDTSEALRAVIFAACINFVLMGVKITTGLIGHSYALVADGIESASDIFTSLITWAGFRLSLRPADEDHPYGHGKIESLTGIISGIGLLAAAIFIAFHSIVEIHTPRHSPEWFTLPVLIIVVLTKVVLSKKIFTMGESVNSRALASDAWHHLSDAITSAAAAIGIMISLVGGEDWKMADAYAALLASVIIAINGGIIIKESLHEVLDGTVPANIYEKIRKNAFEVPGVVNIEKCLIRKSGIDLFVELHVQVDGETSVRVGHEIGHMVKDHLKAAHPHIMDVLVHLEPCEESVPA